MDDMTRDGNGHGGAGLRAWARAAVGGSAAALLLAACTPGASGPNACGADRLNGYIGRPVQQLPELSGVTRVIEPGMMVTQDYWPTRLNVEVNQARRITRVWCG